jgi:hypothetical protein
MNERPQRTRVSGCGAGGIASHPPRASRPTVQGRCRNRRRAGFSIKRWRYTVSAHVCPHCGQPIKEDTAAIAAVLALLREDHSREVYEGADASGKHGCGRFWVTYMQGRSSPTLTKRQIDLMVSAGHLMPGECAGLYRPPWYVARDLPRRYQKKRRANAEPLTAAASGLGSNGSDASEPEHASNDPNQKEVAKPDEGGTP